MDIEILERPGWSRARLQPRARTRESGPVRERRCTGSGARPRAWTQWILQAMAVVLGLGLFQTSLAQREDGVAPMGNWAVHKQATHRGKPLLVHLRTGYERALIMPEPVYLANNDTELPGTSIEIDGEIIGFYPTRSFDWELVTFVGEESGKRYGFFVKASTLGMRQPMEIGVEIQ